MEERARRGVHGCVCMGGGRVKTSRGGHPQTIGEENVGSLGPLLGTLVLIVNRRIANLERRCLHLARGPSLLCSVPL